MEERQQETKEYMYMEAYNGMTVRVPVDKLDEWCEHQEDLKSGKAQPDEEWGDELVKYILGTEEETRPKKERDIRSKLLRVGVIVSSVVSVCGIITAAVIGLFMNHSWEMFGKICCVPLIFWMPVGMAWTFDYKTREKTILAITSWYAIIWGSAIFFPLMAFCAVGETMESLLVRNLSMTGLVLIILYWVAATIWPDK